MLEVFSLRLIQGEPVIAQNEELEGIPVFSPASSFLGMVTGMQS